MSKLERLLYLQGNRCFFCDQPIPKGEATVEHLLPKSKGGGHDDDNCVACCRTINTTLGNLSVKEKIRALLNQRGVVVCPAKLRRSEKECLDVEPPEVPPADEDAPRDEDAPTDDEDARVTAVVVKLEENKKFRPKKRAALRNVVRMILGSKLKGEAIEGVIDALARRKYLVLEGTQVRYLSPQRDLSQAPESFDMILDRHSSEQEAWAQREPDDEDDVDSSHADRIHADRIDGDKNQGDKYCGDDSDDDDDVPF